MANDLSPLITRLALQRGLDPRAVLAVARGEGGTRNRAGDIGDLSGGGSYGPFQLYTKGALPAQYRGRPQVADQWAWSPQGINYALGRMVAAGAGGLKGENAVRTIISKFERPADPRTSIANALARLGAGGGSAATTTALPRVSGPPTPVPQEQYNRSPDSRNILLQGLASGQEVYDLLPQLIAARGSVSPPAPRPMPSTSLAPVPLRSAPVAAETHPGVVNVTGFQPSFAQKLEAMIKASGGRLKVTSGYRSPEHQAQLYAAALKKYGSEHEARRWVAPPGKSNHGKGLAADLGGDLSWAHANAAKFGLYFPLSNENWHIEERGSR